MKSVASTSVFEAATSRESIAGTGLARFGESRPGAREAVRIRWLGVPTCNRVNGLSESLASYLKNFAAHGRESAVLVADDSPDRSTRRAYRERLRSLKRRFGVTICYAGLEEKIRYARWLIQDGSIPPEIVKFALFDLDHSGLEMYGANRNALLLHSVDEPIVCVDDDTCCRIVHHPACRQTLSIRGPAGFSSSAPCEVEAFESRDELLARSTFAEADFLGLHEEMLGRDVSSVRSDWMRSGRFRETGIAVEPGKVLVTLNGLAGDCAWTNPSFYLLLDRASFGRLVRREETFRKALLSRQIVRISPEHTLTRDSRNAPGLLVGLDQRTLLPPYLPLGRAEDTIYWNTLIASVPGCYFAHLPSALLHLPVEERRFWGGQVARSGAGVGLDVVICAMIKQCAASEAGAGGRGMEALGKNLSEWAASKDFAARAAHAVGSEAAAFLEHLESLTGQSFEGSARWKDDLRQFIEVARAAASRSESWLPMELLYQRRPEEAREAVRGLVSRFGMLLSWWPKMIGRARDLRAAGQTIGRNVELDE